jgi:hypothetical protein
MARRRPAAHLEGRGLAARQALEWKGGSEAEAVREDVGRSIDGLEA